MSSYFIARFILLATNIVKEWLHAMPASELTIYLDIVKALVKSGPLTSNQISLLLGDKHPRAFKKRLDFLVKNGMIKEEKMAGGAIYLFAEKGIRLLQYFRVLPPSKLCYA